MTTWADAHARAMVMASQMHADLGLDLSKPIDVFAAIQRLDVVLAFDDLGPNTSGLYLPAGVSQPHTGILVHSLHPRSRQRYTAGHELGHFAFNHSLHIDGDLEEQLESALSREALERWPDDEKEAEAFGAWFLMPRRVLRAGLAHLGLEAPSNPLDVYALSLWLGTSYVATARQLGTTRIVDRFTADGWAKLPPKTLKTALSSGLSMDSYRNDVWWLDEHADGQPVDLRPGDRLLLNLPENPSTGYSWEFSALPEQLELVADSFVDEWEPEIIGDWVPRETSDGEVSAEEFAGGSFSRTFVLDVSRYAEAGIYHLLLSYGRSWDADPEESFELLIAVVPPMHGVQLTEDQLAVA